MHDQDPAGSRQHAQHDPSLIAAFAADDLVATDRDRARLQLEACTDCRALLDDLLAITRFTRALPPVTAPRDFRLTTEQAARLRRRTGLLARILAPFGAAGSVTRPLAATLTTLGLVGVFVGSSAAGMLGGAASMAAPEGAGSAAGAPGPVASAAPGIVGPAVAPSPADRDTTTDSTDASAEPIYGQAPGGAGDDLGADDGRLDAQPSPPNPFLLGSFALLATGLLLFALRFAARRVR